MWSLTYTPRFVALANSSAALLSPIIAGVIYDKTSYSVLVGLCCGLLGLDALFRLTFLELNKHSASRIEVTNPINPTSSIESDRSVPSEDSSTSADSDTTLVENVKPTQLQYFNIQGHLSENKPKRFATPAYPRLLKSKRMIGVCVANMTIAMILTAFEVVLPAFVHEFFD